MNPIKPSADWQPLEAAFRQVFRSRSPFDNAFQERITHKLIVYPTAGMHLTEEQYAALVHAARHVGDSTFYVSEIEMPSAFSEPYDPARPTHWLADVTCSYATYGGTTIVLENSLYSSMGKWGVLLSAEDHAIVGGSHAFIRAFQDAYPQWQAERSRFISYWQDYCRAKQVDTAWLSDYVSTLI